MSTARPRPTPGGSALGASAPGGSATPGVSSAPGAAGESRPGCLYVVSTPIGDLYKSQVRQLAAAVGVPDEVIRKAPSADLWPGQTDEAEAGFSYPELDRLLYWMIDRRRDDEELEGLGFAPDFVARVHRLVATSEFKRQMPPIAKLGPRTTGVDYLYPRRRPGSART